MMIALRVLYWALFPFLAALAIAACVVAGLAGAVDTALWKFEAWCFKERK